MNKCCICGLNTNGAVPIESKCISLHKIENRWYCKVCIVNALSLYELVVNEETHRLKAVKKGMT